jgi:MFS family permease
MFVAHGLTPVQVATTLIAWSLIGIAMQIPAGALADRWSRRGVLAIGQTIRAVGFLIWVIWPTYPGFLLGMMAWGIKSAMTNGIFEALLYDELAALDRRESYARLVGRAAAVGYVAVFAASIGAFWSVSFGYPAVILASTAATGAAAIAAMSLPHVQPALAINRSIALKQALQAAAFAIRHPVLPWIIGLAAMSIAFGGGLDGFWPIYASDAGLSLENVALFSGAISIGQIVANVMAHRLKSAPEAGFYLLLFGMGALLILATGIHRPWTIAIVALVPGLFKIIDVNFDARLQNLIASESRATIGAIKTFSGQIVMSGVLVAFGALAQATSYRMAFLGCGIALAGIAITFLVARRKIV